VDAGVVLRTIARISGKNDSAPLIKVLGLRSELNGSELTASRVKDMTARDITDVSEIVPISTMGATVQIFFADHTQQQQADLAWAALREVGYAVSRPLNVEAKAPGTSEIRFFRFPTDKAESDFISKLLGRFDSNLRSRFITDADNVAKIKETSKPIFEVWFGPKAFSPETSSGHPQIARIFIQVGPKSNARAKDLKERLEESRFWVGTSENAGLDATEAELRYGKAFPDDVGEAGFLLQLLKKLGISPIANKPVAVDLPTDSGPRHFELLLP
jgi:hypothetical protein